MMKKYIFLTILLLFTLPLVVHADEDKNINDLQLKKPIEIVSKDETKSYENMNIDVQVPVQLQMLVPKNERSLLK